MYFNQIKWKKKNQNENETQTSWNVEFLDFSNPKSHYELHPFFIPYFYNNSSILLKFL